MKATELLNILYDTSLKVRLLREHEKNTTAGQDELSSRELLACELIQSYGPLLERQLGTILGLQSSSLADLVTGLCKRGLVHKDTGKEDRRRRPLKLTDTGRRVFQTIKHKSALRYWYLFRGLPLQEDRDKQFVEKILRQMNDNASQLIKQRIFGEIPEELDQLLAESVVATRGRKPREPGNAAN